MTATIRLAASFTLILTAAAADAGLLDKVKNAAKSAVKAAGSAAASAAKAAQEGAKQGAHAAASLADAALKGVQAFPAGVKTRGLYSAALEKACPGVGARRDGCSNPLPDAITKGHGKLFIDVCNDHDLCYVMSDHKQACDTAFRDSMYALCEALPLAKKALCVTTAHTWFAALAHSLEPTRRHKLERDWAKKTCKTLPEISKTTRMVR